MSNYTTIGILGGMGPEATAELYKRIVRIYQRECSAVDDADYPNILINSVPVEDMLNDIAMRKPIIVSQLQKAAQVLEIAGAAFIALPCNTATIFLNEIRASVAIPVLDITELTSQYVSLEGYMTIGMLASSSTITTKIYELKLKKRGITMLKPNKKDQILVNQIIMRILAGEKNQSDRQTLRAISSTFVSRGAESVVLGCTELPLLVSKFPNINLVDTIEILARAVVRTAVIEKSNRKEVYDGKQ